MSFFEPSKDELDLLSKRMNCKILDYFDFGKTIRKYREDTWVLFLYGFLLALCIGIVIGMAL